MPVELRARTEPGKRLIALAETLANEIAPSAAAHDHDASFAFTSLTAVKASGYLTAPIPEVLGGLGVNSVHDVLVASSRLARGDASLTLGINMHLAYLLNVVRRWQIAVAAGDERRTAAFTATLEQIVRDGTVFASAGSERGQDLTRPTTSATRTKTGWVVDGHKVYCTMAPAADVLYTAVTYLTGDGRERYGYAMIPGETPGVIVHDDWDALGMRASASHSVSFENVQSPLSALRGGFATGDAVEYMERNLNAGLFHQPPHSASPKACTQSWPLGFSSPDAGPAHTRPCGREPHRPLCLPSNLLTGRHAHRRAPGAQPALHRHIGGADEPVRRGPEREGVHQRSCRPHRRSGARSLRRSRLPERQPSRTRLPLRPRHRIHASARRQPRLHIPRTGRRRPRTQPRLNGPQRRRHLSDGRA